MILFCPIAIFQKLNHDQWKFGNVMCRLYNSVLYVNMYVQILFLTLMAFDRYLAVVQHGNGSQITIIRLTTRVRNSLKRPILRVMSRYRKSQLVIGCTCLLMWTLGIIAALPIMFRSTFKTWDFV